MTNGMKKLLAIATVAGAIGAASAGAVAPAQAATFAPAAESARSAAPALTEQVRSRKRPRIVCGVRYRRFYNGIFWSRAPFRVCWRRY